MFDAEFYKDSVINWIKNWFENRSGNAKGIIIGISGGKDSTVAAAYARKPLVRIRF